MVFNTGSNQIGIKVVVLGVAEAHRQLGAMRNDLTRFASDVDRSSTAAASFGRSMVRTGDALVSFGRTLTFTVTAPILGALTALTRAGINFEDSFAGVTKTVEGLSQGFDDLATSMYGTTTGLTDAQKAAVFANKSFGDLTDEGLKLRDNLRGLALDIPISANELANIGMIAGQLGVRGTKQITDFTEVIAKLGVATDLSTEQAAFAIARMGNIMGVETSQMGEYAKSFGASVVGLGNNVAATESEITNMALRLAAAGRVVNLSSADILGLSAALAEMGVKAERGGTAVSRVIYEMLYAIADGGDNLELFAQITGQTTSQFAADFKKDALGSLQRFIVKLADLQDQGKITADTMTALGLSGVRVREVLNILGPNMELVKNDIKLANEQWVEQIALQEEATKRFKTMKSQLTLLKNAFVDLGITIFDAIKDDLSRFVSGFTALVKKIKEIDPAILKLAIRFGLLASAVGPVMLIFGTFLQLMGNSILSMGGLTHAFKGLLSLPFAPFLGVFGLLFGKKATAGSKATKGIFSGLTKLIPKPQSLAKDIKGLLGVFTGVFGGLTRPLTKVFSTVFGTALGGAFKIISKGPGTLIGIARAAISGLLSGALDLLTGFPLVGNIVGGLIRGITLPIQYLVDHTFGSLSFVLKSTLGIFGDLIGGGLKRIPVFGSTLIKWIIAPIKQLPTLLALAAGGFTLLFAPKVISQLIKNKDKVFEEINKSVKQLPQDMKKFGLEKAILLFFSGGSTGSGREGGLFNISKALGAGEEAAKKFSYAMGVASFWVLKTVKATGLFIKQLLFGKDASDSISKSAKSTSDRLVSLSAGLAKFFEGFFLGWTKSFGGIEDAFKGFTGAVGDAFGSFGRLFDAIFGDANKESKDFIQTLEPGVRTGAVSVGETIGSILGEIVTLTLRGLQLLAEITTVVINAFTSVVTAYKSGGFKGVMEELGPILADIWSGITTAAGNLWDNVKPEFENFITQAADWLAGPGVQGLAVGAKSLIKAITDAFSNLWNDQEIPITQEMRIPVLSQRMNGLQSAQFATSTFNAGNSETQTTLQAGLRTQLSNLIQEMVDYLKSDETKTRVTGWLTTVGTWLSDNVQLALNPLMDSIGNWLTTTAWPAVRDWGKQFITQFALGIADQILGDNPISKALEILFPQFSGLKESLALLKQINGEEITPKQTTPKAADIKNLYLPPAQRQALIDYLNDAGIEIGNQLMQHISQGVLTGQDQLYIQTQLSLQGAIDQAKTTTGENSPSRVFYEIGRNLIIGLINGIYSQQYGLSGVINSILSQLIGFSNSVSSIANSIRSTLQSLFSFAQIVLSTLSSTVGNALSTVFGSTTVNRTTNSTSSTYAPVFNNPQPQTISQNSQVYGQYLLANQAVG